MINWIRSGKATVFLVEFSGGLLVGDRNVYNITIEEKTEIILNPQPATEVYPDFNDKPSEQKVLITIKEHASLEWEREEVITFQATKFHGIL